MKYKDEMLNALTNEYQSLHPIAKIVTIQYYQAKIIVDELVKEGKVEATPFGKRLKYRKKILVGNLTH